MQRDRFPRPAAERLELGEGRQREPGAEMVVDRDEQRCGPVETRAHLRRIAQRRPREAEEEIGDGFAGSIILRDEGVAHAGEPRARLGCTTVHDQLADAGERILGECRSGHEQGDTSRNRGGKSQEIPLRTRDTIRIGLL